VALLSSVEAWVKTGQFQQMSNYDEYPSPNDNPYLVPQNLWHPPVHEPLQAALAAPLYALAWQTPRLGLLHTVWLLNLGVALLTAAALYWGGMALGYSPRAAFCTALLAALGTQLWHYSQTFFREPLMGLCLLLSFLAALLWTRHRGPWPLLFSLIFWALAWQTKGLSLAFLPILLALFLSWERLPRWAWGTLGLVALLGLILGAGLVFSQEGQLGWRGRVLSHDREYVLTVISSYFFSPGRSLWATGPILLLSFYGAYVQRREWRFYLPPYLFFVLIVLAYALGGRDWHGGRGWGARYLVPVIPMMSLLLLPVWEAWFAGRLQRWARAGIVGVAFFSVLIQLGGVFTPLEVYYQTIAQAFPEDFLGGVYNKSSWQLNYTQWYITLRALGEARPDVAWSYSESWAWGPLLGGAWGLLALGLVAWGRGGKQIPWGGAIWAGMFVLSALWMVGRLGDDRRLAGNQGPAASIAVQLGEETRAGDWVFLSDPHYKLLFLNAYKGPARLVTLPYLPGERYSPEAPPLDRLNPDERLTRPARLILEEALRGPGRVWLLSQLGPYQPWAYRPAEHFLSRQAYLLRAQDFGPRARLLLFDSTPAPAYDPRYQTLYVTPRPALRFGESIQLSGYDFPGEVLAGEALTLSTAWEALGPIPWDYSISVQVVTLAGEVVAQHDGPAAGGFDPMPTWQPGRPYADHRGVVIPDTLEPGGYQVQLILYDWRDGARLPIYAEGGEFLGDKVVLGELAILGGN
jgi:hypothetical protein